jgi:hypothetical protein
VDGWSPCKEAEADRDCEIVTDGGVEPDVGNGSRGKEADADRDGEIETDADVGGRSFGGAIAEELPGRRADGRGMAVAPGVVGGSFCKADRMIAAVNDRPIDNGVAGPSLASESDQEATWLLVPGRDRGDGSPWTGTGGFASRLSLCCMARRT